MIEINRIVIYSADNVRSFRAGGEVGTVRWIGHSANTPLEAVLNLVERIAARKCAKGMCQICGRGKVHYHCKRCRRYLCQSCRASQVGQSTRQAVCGPCLSRGTASRPPVAT